MFYNANDFSWINHSLAIPSCLICKAKRVPTRKKVLPGETMAEQSFTFPFVRNDLLKCRSDIARRNQRQPEREGRGGRESFHFPLPLLQTPFNAPVIVIYPFGSVLLSGRALPAPATPECADGSHLEGSLPVTKP